MQVESPRLHSTSQTTGPSPHDIGRLFWCLGQLVAGGWPGITLTEKSRAWGGHTGYSPTWYRARLSLGQGLSRVPPGLSALLITMQYVRTGPFSLSFPPPRPFSLFPPPLCAGMFGRISRSRALPCRFPCMLAYASSTRAGPGYEQPTGAPQRVSSQPGPFDHWVSRLGGRSTPPSWRGRNPMMTDRGLSAVHMYVLLVVYMPGYYGIGRSGIAGGSKHSRPPRWSRHCA